MRFCIAFGANELAAYIAKLGPTLVVMMLSLHYRVVFGNAPGNLLKASPIKRHVRLH
jgi:hypothetical protein